MCPAETVDNVSGRGGEATGGEAWEVDSEGLGGEGEQGDDEGGGGVDGWVKVGEGGEGWKAVVRVKKEGVVSNRDSK